MVFTEEFYSVMNKNKDVMKARREFVAEQIKTRPHEKVETVVRRVANQLFLSEATVWQDLRKHNEQRK